MKDTVFSPAFGNRPSCLVGRDTVISCMLDGLKDPPGSRNRATLLLGQRGSGKTVLLWELADRARTLGFVVASPTIATEDMLERILEKIQDDGEQYGKEKATHLTGGSIGALGFSAGLQFSRDTQESKTFQYKLSRLCNALAPHGKGVLILVDETQGNDPRIRQLVAAYQELVGNQANIALVMAGLPGAVSATLNDRVLTFLNRANKMQLDPLAPTDIDAFFIKAFAQMGLCVPEPFRNRAVAATFGSPYLLQLVGHNIVTYSEEGAIGESELERALAQARTSFENDVCGTTLAALSDKDICFLRAMAEDQRESRIADIAVRMGVSYDYAQKYRKRLIDGGIVEPARRGSIRFAVPHLADHLRKTSEIVYGF
ncbi:MAG: ATP-binding protein [Gordonibacter sp.]|uniref:ATP-binding protein n=1 Tax=Gordonibacter sp. TaxID=1968902 RepID=UPI002FC79118